MNGKKRFISLLIGPAIYALIKLLLKDSFTLPGAEAVGVLLWMIFWWITRPVDMTVTALLPIVINSVFHVIDMGVVTSQYFSDSIILILRYHGSQQALIDVWRFGFFLLLDRRCARRLQYGF